MENDSRKSKERRLAKGFEPVVKALSSFWEWSRSTPIGDVYLYWEEGNEDWNGTKRLLERPRESAELKGGELDLWRGEWERWGGTSFEGKISAVDVVTSGREVAMERIEKEVERSEMLHIIGIEYLYNSGEKGARGVLKMARRGSRILVDLTGPDMTFRYRRRFVGNLVRFRLVSMEKMFELEGRGGFEAPVM